MTFAALVDHYRRAAAETLIGWAMRLYPARTEADGEVLRALLGALKAALGGIYGGRP